VALWDARGRERAGGIWYRVSVVGSGMRR